MMGITKKYIQATQSSNLRNDSRHSDTDILAAIALSGGPLGNLALRAKMTIDAISLHELRRQWLDVVAKTAFIQSWPAHIKVHRVAMASLDWWYNDVCQSCFGRKSDQIDNTPCLTGVDCAACSGTGKRNVPCDGAHVPYAVKMAYALDAELLSVLPGAKAKLGN